MRGVWLTVAVRYQQVVKAMKRTIEQWKNCDPKAMAREMSEAAQMFAFEDAKADILELHSAVIRCQEALDEISELAAWQSDDDAREDDTRPTDVVAHVNGLIRKRCRDALDGRVVDGTENHCTERTACEWLEDEDGEWWPTCEDDFVVLGAPPTKLEMRFCCYCGGELVEVAFAHPDGSEDE